MKKMMMAVAGLAMAVVLTGCGGSPKGVAEEYAEALCRRDMEKVMALRDTNGSTEKQIKEESKAIDEAIKKDDDLKDDKLEAQTLDEEIMIPSDSNGYQIKNGKKYTGEEAKVKIQFVKGKDKKSFGLKVTLEKVGGKWKVTGHHKIKIDDDE